MTEAFCLALVIYFESRGEPDIGQFYVADTVLNRVESPRYPNTVCKVMRQKHQFSFWNDKHSNTPRKNHHWKKARKIANAMMINKSRRWKGCHYHATYVNPRWARSFRRNKVIGQHIFYDGGCYGKYGKKKKRRYTYKQKRAKISKRMYFDS